MEIKNIKENQTQTEQVIFLVKQEKIDNQTQYVINLDNQPQFQIREIHENSEETCVKTCVEEIDNPLSVENQIGNNKGTIRYS